MTSAPAENGNTDLPVALEAITVPDVAEIEPPAPAVEAATVLDTDEIEAARREGREEGRKEGLNEKKDASNRNVIWIGLAILVLLIAGGVTAWQLLEKSSNTEIVVWLPPTEADCEAASNGIEVEGQDQATLKTFGVDTCIVDSGVYVNHKEFPYSRGDGYTTGRSFGSASNNLWYRPVIQIMEPMLRESCLPLPTTMLEWWVSSRILLKPVESV
mmetsp:Transcript_42400/g.102479  ORF Transcript_42400/g.102479 Transcript_42400/m.102479 type:complete len:215 (+) Transcript_42400:2894-3538(+)